jgi:hypothetical protein
VNDAILTAWCIGIVGTLCASGVACELWRSRERWREEAEKQRRNAAGMYAENLRLSAELARRTK